MRPAPPLSQGLDDCPPPPPPLIWRLGSATVFYYNLHSMQRKLCLIAYRGSWFCSWFREFFWILNLPPPPPPNRRVNFLGEFELQKNCYQSCSSKNFFGLVEMTFGLVDASCTIVFLGTLLHMYWSIGFMLSQSVVKSALDCRAWGHRFDPRGWTNTQEWRYCLCFANATPWCCSDDYIKWSSHLQ